MGKLTKSFSVLFSVTTGNKVKMCHKIQTSWINVLNKSIGIFSKIVRVWLPIKSNPGILKSGFPALHLALSV